MQRNDFDTFDELVRGKLAGYNEPPEYESLSKIHAKKARITSLYQLYRLMMVLLVAGIGMLTSVLLIQQPTATEKVSSSEPSSTQPAITPVNRLTNTQAEFASAQVATQNNLLIPSHNIQQTSKEKQFVGSSSNNTTSSYTPSATKTKNNRTTGVTPVSKSNTNIATPQSVSNPAQPQSTEKGATEVLIEPKTNPADNRTDSMSKVTQKDQTCDVAFDFYSSYNGEFTFHAAGSSNTAKLVWDFGDGQTSSDQSPVHTFGRSGTYTVTLISTDGGKKCVAKASKEIVLGPKPSPKQSLHLNGSLLAGTDIVSNGTIEVYAFDETSAKYSTVLSVKTKTDGSFDIPLTAGVRYLLKGYPAATNNNYLPTFWGNTQSTDDASEIVLNPSEHLDIIGYNIQLVANEKVPESTEQEYQPVAHADNQVVIVDENNNIVGMGYVDQNGQVVPNSGMQPGNYVAVNQTTGKSNTVAVSSSGKVSTSPDQTPSDDNKVEVFPNPVDNTVNFGINSFYSDAATLVVMNAAGFELMRKSVNFVPGFNQLQYDLSAYPSGIYYVMVFKGNSPVMSNRIVKMGEIGK